MKENIYQKINNISLIIIAGAIIMAVLIYTKTVLIPLVVSLFIYAMMIPARRFLERKFKIPSMLAAFVVFFAFLAFLVVVGLYVGNSLGDFLKSANVYEKRLLDTTTYIVTKAQEHGFSINKENLLPAIKDLPLLTMFSKVGGGVFTFVGNFLLIIVFILFLILGTKKEEKITNKLILQIQTRISKYISVKLFISAITGFFTWIVFASFNVELAFMFAFLTFLLNFIPSIGSIVATVIPLPVIFLQQFGFTVDFFTILALLIGIQFIMGQIIEPKIMGHDMDLHPIVLLSCLIFWGLVWGVVGMFLAVPITSVIQIILSKISTTRPAAELMAGRLPK